MWVSIETRRRGDAAAAAWIFRGDGVCPRRKISARPRVRRAAVRDLHDARQKIPEPLRHDDDRAASFSKRREAHLGVRAAALADADVSDEPAAAVGRERGHRQREKPVAPAHLAHRVPEARSASRPAAFLVAAAYPPSPRLVTAEYPCCGRGGAATWYRGILASWPRRRRDSLPRKSTSRLRAAAIRYRGISMV